MSLRRTSLSLTVERELPIPDGSTRRYRLTAQFAVEPADAPVSPEELQTRFRGLSEELERAVPPEARAPARTERSLAELVDTYRPRQRELVELLLAEGEVTTEEHQRLVRYLEERAAGVAAEVPVTERPIAAAPLANDRTNPSIRPVAELLRLYQIASLKQAGAVRGRRQISYEEYMALKRHFAAAESAPPAGDPPRT